MQIAKLGIKSGSRYSLYKARKTFASAEHSQQLETDFQMRTAQDVTEHLGNMKGALMKIGQMASYLDTGLGDNVKQTLASLQQDAPPMSTELVAAEIERELGGPPQSVFLEWDPKPIAAASIGQVHKAITREGAAVAVKVQYPNIAEAIGSDIKKADWVFKAMTVMFPGVDPEPVIEEIRLRLIEELDYEKEAFNQRYFHKHFDGHPYMQVPAVFDDYSTSKVLTSELITGSTLSDVLTWDQKEKNQIAETLFRFSFGAIYQLNSFNGDPHPGNYIFNKGGKVAFLDFGLVKKFTDDETKLFEVLIKSMVLNPDKALFRKQVEDAGILPSGLTEFSDDHIHEYFRYFYEYVIEDRDLRIDETYTSDGVSRLFNMKGPYGDLMKTMNVPPSLVIIQRITLGLMGIFSQLNATANWQRISKEIWPFVGAEPSTPMAEKIAEWESSKQVL